MKSVLRRFAAGALLCCSLAAPVWAQFSVGSGATYSVPAGGTNVGCLSVDVQGTLATPAGQFTTASSLAIGATGIFDGGAGTLSVGGTLSNAGTFNAGAGTVVLNDGCAGGTSQLSGDMVFQNLTLSSVTGRTFVIPAGSHITVLGMLTLQGTGAQSIQLVSSGAGTAVIQLGPAAVVNRNFANVAGNVQIGAAIAGGAAPIPTLGTPALLLLSVLLGGLALRRRPGVRRPF